MEQTGTITVSVHCEQSYRYDVAEPVNVLKRGRQHRNIKLTVSPTNRPISGAKLKDIHNLLRVTCGPKWRKLHGTEVYQKLRAVEDATESIKPDDNCVWADVDISFRV